MKNRNSEPISFVGRSIDGSLPLSESACRRHRLGCLERTTSGRSGMVSSFPSGQLPASIGGSILASAEALPKTRDRECKPVNHVRVFLPENENEDAGNYLAILALRTKEERKARNGLLGMVSSEGK